MPNPIDLHICVRLRKLRIANGVTQIQLAEELGINNLQMQKYEEADNLISASLLYDIADIFDVPIQHFFEGYHDSDWQEPQPETYCSNVHELNSQESLRLLANYKNVENVSAKHAISSLVETLAQNQTDRKPKCQYNYPLE